MRSRTLLVAVLFASAEGGLSGCGSGDDASPPAPADAGPDGTMSQAGDAASDANAKGGDGGSSDASEGDATTDGSTSEASVADGAAEDAPVGDAPASGTAADAADGAASDGSGLDAGVATRLLLSYNSYAGALPSELVAFDVASSSVAGRLAYTGTGTTYVGTTAPWLLKQSADVVVRLDAAQPWVVDSSWNVTQIPDAASNADPQAVLVNAGTKAYVLPYLRNAISVIDTSVAVDAGLPTKTIDLSALVQPDGDGTLEMTGGFYVPSQERVYVLLANINQNAYDANTGYLQCAGKAAPTIIAIDTTNDSLVSLASADGGASDGAAAGPGIALPGRTPAFGSGALAYDAVGNRVLVLEGGCTSLTGDGGDGPLVGAEVDALSLDTGASSVLLDLSNQELPAQLVYMDGHHALVQVGYGPFTTYAWDPTTTTLGSAIPNAPDAFAWDGAGNLLGVTSLVDADSGSVTGYDVVSVKLADGTVTKLASNPFTLTGGGVSGVQLWPAP